jgi:hypothetical protein
MHIITESGIAISDRHPSITITDRHLPITIP